MSEVDIYYDEILYEEYSKIPLEKRKGLQLLAKEWKVNTPLQGKKVLLNCHLTQSTLIIIDLLLLARAEVVVTSTPELAVHMNATETLAKANIKYYPDTRMPAYFNDKYFDIVIDCGAGLLSTIKPKLGMVELTKTESQLYKNIDFPVITVDDSKLKVIETFGGTGDGFVRALIQYQTEVLLFKIDEREYRVKKTEYQHDDLVSRLNNLTGRDQPQPENLKNDSAAHTQKIKDEIQRLEKRIRKFERLILFRHQDLIEKQLELDNLKHSTFSNKQYIIFGYGKVGNGIANALTKAGVKPNNITIIEPQAELCEKAEACNYQAIQLVEKNNKIIKEHLKKASFVITATGKAQCISEYFDAADFPLTTLKINMGTPDEWGYKFKDSLVLNDKKPFNFSLEYPTDVAYLDPIFKALMISCIELSVFSKEKGLLALSEKIDNDILTEWKNSYPDLANDFPFGEISKKLEDYNRSLFFKVNSSEDMSESSDTNSTKSWCSTDSNDSDLSTVKMSHVDKLGLLHIRKNSFSELSLLENYDLLAEKRRSI